MPQVIIVSNRLPVSVEKKAGRLVFKRSAGGLATGLSSFTRRGQSRWIGWPGIASDNLTAAERQTITERLDRQHCTPVFLTQRQIDDFYSGYSNSVLWPLFHNLGQRLPGKSQHKRWWQAYRQVNRQYAQTVQAESKIGARIWVHDYQLMLLPAYLRAEQADSIIGFFLHIPFPSPRIYQRLPEAKTLIKGMLGADLVGFHTASYTDNFLANCAAHKIMVSPAGEPVIDGRTVRVASFPMGIDYDKYASAPRSKAVRAAVRRYRQRYKRRKVIVAVDRLDPSKGLVERLRAYAMLLEQYPKLRGKVVFSLVAAPSRTDVPAYRELAKRLDALVNEINATYGTPKWQPVDYMNVLQPFEEVTALFQVADVAFIAPLRDGMNLAAKEFVASKRGRGVLVLSETAGAAEELQDALLVDPKRPETVVAALHQALTMRRRELRRRLRNMKQELTTNTVQDWSKGFVNALQTQITPGAFIVRSLYGRPEKALLQAWQRSRKQLLLLDYDGSLVPFTEDFQTAEPPKNLLKLLENLSSSPNTEVVLVSGRSAKDLQQWFGKLPINLVAEHGATLKRAGNKTWQTLEKIDTQWKQVVQPILEAYAEQAPGIKLEVKPHSIVWHYRTASPYYAQKYNVIIRRQLRPLLKRYGLEILQGNKVIEIKNPRISKGTAARRWLNQHNDFILAIGDDATDEALFADLPATAYSVKVGRGRTQAHYRLPDSKAVIALLRQLV